ncbi:alanine--tRNA ligase [Tanacetum coccineum]
MGSEESPVEWPVNKVRETFIKFFKDKGHVYWEPSPVVPVNDPSLLFANAGRSGPAILSVDLNRPSPRANRMRLQSMNQYKPIFLGTVDRNTSLGKLTRACNSQKCIRAGRKHNDLDDVGKDTYHHTFFEMLRNWSFGDYFKNEAIEWAWELLTTVYKLPTDRIYVTYFGGDKKLGLQADNEARDIWLKYLPAKRVLPFGCKDNFWEMGDEGPCGPCSEIHFDRVGGRDGAKLNGLEDGSLVSLHSKHDTGMGLERLTSILQNKLSNYDTDVFIPIFEAIYETIKKVDGVRQYRGKIESEDEGEVDKAYRVVADHIRTLSFAIADGSRPGNKDRQYVLRHILRRAVYYGTNVLKAKYGFLNGLVKVVVDVMGDVYPELKQEEMHIKNIIAEEEKSFEKTLSRGKKMFDKAADAVKDQGKNILSGQASLLQLISDFVMLLVLDAFILYGTYGYPLLLIQEMAAKEKLIVDVDLGPLSGKGPRVIVSADESNLPRITSLKCVLTQEHLDAICAKYFVPEEVHPQLPSPDATMHERPTGKVGMYTRFFDYANYRIPFSTFFMSVLTHFRISFSQLSVFWSAKVSHFEILCRVCNIEPNVSLFRYFYTHNYKNGWFGFTKHPNVRACYSKNLDSVKNWNDHFFWVDEFVVPANARFSWFSGSNIVKDRAPAPSEYNTEHINTLIAQASPFLRFPEEFLCWVGISRNYLLNKDTYPRFEYENGEEMDLNAFIRTADPHKVRVVERARAKNERPIVTVAKHRTVTLLPTSVVRSSGELSASVEREFVGDASVGDGGDQGFDSIGGQGNVEPTVPVTEPVETEIPVPKRSKKKRATRESERMPAASHQPKRLRADYGTTGGYATRGKSPSVLNKLLQDSRLMVEQGVPALPTLPFITSSVTASPLEEGGDHTDSTTGAKSADPEVDSLVRSAAPIMTEATTVATTVAIPANISKDKSVPHPSVFGSSSSSEKTGRTLSLFTGRSGSGFDAGSIRVEEAMGASLEETYVPEWTVTRGFELNDGRLCANMIDHFTPPAFFKTVRGIEHEQLFIEFNVSAARNLSLSSEVRMRAEYNILEKRKWRSLGEEKDILLEAKDKEIEDLKFQLLKANEESADVAQLRAQLKVTGLESTIAEKDHELSDLGASSSSLKSQNQSLVNQVHELETSSADLREKLEMYEGSLKQLKEFQDNLMGPLRTRLVEIDADFTRCCMRFQESFHPHLLNVVAGRRWLLTHGMKLLVVKCLNSNEYMEALGHAFGRAIEKGMQEGLAAGIEHGQAGICLTDLEAYIPSAEDNFNSAIRDLRDRNFPLLQELSNKKDANTWDIINLLRLDDVVAETVGMTDLQPDVSQLMVPVHHKHDRVVIGSQALSIALDIFCGRVEKMERNLIERLPFLKDVFVSIDDPLSTEALIEPPVEVPATNVLSTVVIAPHTDPSVSIEDYDNPDLVDVVPENATLGSEGVEEIDASARGDLTFSQLDDEARDAVL